MTIHRHTIGPKFMSAMASSLHMAMQIHPSQPSHGHRFEIFLEILRAMSRKALKVQSPSSWRDFYIPQWTQSAALHQGETSLSTLPCCYLTADLNWLYSLLMLTSNSDIIYFIQSKNSSNDVNWQLMLHDAANCSPVFSPKEGHFDTRHCPLSPEAWYPSTLVSNEVKCPFCHCPLCHSWCWVGSLWSTNPHSANIISTRNFVALSLTTHALVLLSWKVELPCALHWRVEESNLTAMFLKALQMKFWCWCWGHAFQDCTILPNLCGMMIFQKLIWTSSVASTRSIQVSLAKSSSHVILISLLRYPKSNIWFILVAKAIYVP